MTHPHPQIDDPWRPMSKPIDLKHLGKLAEELNEAGAAVARCIIQGIDEVEPVTKKPNRQRLEEELADVFANMILVEEHFLLDSIAIEARAVRKIEYLRCLRGMLDEQTPQISSEKIQDSRN